MQLDLGCNRIRFMNHPLSYYSDGHHLIRITSGLLSGFEGYIIRISRNKCLVTSIGGITVAINGINRESFENVDEYVRQSLGLRKIVDCDGNTCLEDEKCLFKPQNQLDIIAIAECLQQRISQARVCREKGDYEDATSILLDLLKKTGTWLKTTDKISKSYKTKDILIVCRDAYKTLLLIENDERISVSARRSIEEKRQLIDDIFPNFAFEMIMQNKNV